MRVLLSWSSGKDSAWTLHMLRARGVEVTALLTAFNEQAARAAMHAVRAELVEAQAAAAGLPLHAVALPWPCANAEYETRMAAALQRARSDGITHIAFGDLHLAGVRDYRINMLAGSGIEPLFPLWRAPNETSALARGMIDAGLRAVLTCVDPKQLAQNFCGRRYDHALLGELPATVDHCGENGEFHTFCFAGPMFANAIPVRAGETVTRDGFVFTDFTFAAKTAAA